MNTLEKSEKISRLKSELQKVAKTQSLQSRGLEFEKWLCELFKLFNLFPKMNIVIPGQQIDISILFDSRVFLVEAKWLRKRVGEPEVREFYGKLMDRNVHTCGIIVSMSGFTDTAKNYLRKNRERIILLIKGEELHYVLSGFDMCELLQQKLRSLSEMGEQWFPSEDFIRSKRSRVPKHTSFSGLKSSTKANGKLVPYFQTMTNGDTGCVIYSPIFTTFGKETHYIEATTGTLDFSEFSNILNLYEKHFEITPDNGFCINQKTCRWFGTGKQNFLKALRLQKKRYKGVDLEGYHRSETTCIVDEIYGGLFFLSAQLSTRSKTQHFSYVNIGFMFEELPFDTSRFKKFYGDLGLHVYYYRHVIDSPTFVVNHPKFKIEPLRHCQITVKGLDKEEDVIGILIKNPFRYFDIDKCKNNRTIGSLKYTEIPLLKDNELSIGHLRGYHSLKDSVRYGVNRVTITAIPSAGFSTLLVSIFVDWE